METELPHVGFGTYKLTGDTGLDIIAQAIQSGYTLLDTAAYYENEKQVADAIEQASADPQQLTVVTKLWKTDMGYDSARRAIDNSLKNLRKAQLDIYLIHWPAPANLPNRENKRRNVACAGKCQNRRTDQRNWRKQLSEHASTAPLSYRAPSPVL